MFRNRKFDLFIGYVKIFFEVLFSIIPWVIIIWIFYFLYIDYKNDTRIAFKEYPKTLGIKEFYPISSEIEVVGEAVKISNGSDLVEIKSYTAQQGVIIMDDEGDLSDAKMTLDTKNRAINLATLVREEWGDVIYLRIREAWSTNDNHLNYSIHHEGRALDITTSDNDKNKLGRLAGLAIEAGFDWVWYEDSCHVHVSVKR